MPTFRRLTLAASLSVVALGACDNKTATPKQASPTATATTTTTAVAKTTGLAAAGNDQAVVTLAKAAIACKWTAAGLASNCAALKAWRISPLLKNGKADATLLHMLEDNDKKVRWLSATALKTVGRSHRNDKAAATRLLDALDKEKDPSVLGHLGAAVGRIDLAKTGLEARVKKLIEKHPSKAVRQSIVRSVLSGNRTLMFDYLMKVAREDKDGQMRKAAAAAFWTGTPPGKHEDACKLWLELAKDGDHDLAGNSAYHCAFYPTAGGCVGQWDELLDVIEKKASDGKVVSTMTATALRYLYNQKKASDKQESRAIAIAKKIASNTDNKATARGRAIELVAKLDPKGKAFAKKFEGDKDGYVKSVAKRAQAAPKKKK